MKQALSRIPLPLPEVIAMLCLFAGLIVAG